MIKPDLVILDGGKADPVSDRLQSVFSTTSAPRIHSPLNDLPSRGDELIDFAVRVTGDIAEDRMSRWSAI